MGAAAANDRGFAGERGLFVGVCLGMPGSRECRKDWESMHLSAVALYAYETNSLQVELLTFGRADPLAVAGRFAMPSQSQADGGPRGPMHYASSNMSMKPLARA